MKGLGSTEVEPRVWMRRGTLGRACVPGSEEGSYLRLIDFSTTQFWARE